MEEECSPKYRATGLGDLPESSIACILSLTSPTDVGRLACVSRSFQSASDSDVVWERMLPSFYADILAEAVDAPASTCSRKEVYNFLCKRVLHQNGTRDFWLDRGSGSSCQSIGARELAVIWGSDDRYWAWCPKAGARFAEVAYLKFVWWLEVKGRWQCRLSPGTYTFSWRLSLPSFVEHEKIGPVTFSFEATGNAPVNTECYLTGDGARKVRGELSEGQQQPLGYRRDSNAWMELDVGEFIVGIGDSPFQIEFQLKQIDCSRTKGKMYIDGVMIRPSTTIQNRIPLSEIQFPEETRVRYLMRAQRRR